jgi:hypothetical protein
MNWLLIGFTAVMTGFVLFVRLTDYLKYQKLTKTFFERNPDFEILLEDKKTVWLLFILGGFASSFAFIVEGPLYERIALAALFLFLVASEGVNAWMNSRLYSSSKEFLYGLMYERYRSIKTYKAKGKRKTILFTLKNEEYVIPNDIVKIIQAQQKQLKSAKKS